MGMRTFLAFARRGPLNRATALNCLVINQLATPGLGTIMAGYWVMGMVELSLALIGFTAIVGWMWQWFARQIQSLQESAPAVTAHSSLGWIGLTIFALAWLLSASSSWRLWRAARRNEAGQPPVIPGPKPS